MTPYIISGLVVGSIYAISALGLVLTYTSSRVFNFAHGAIAYAIAVFYYYLTRAERLEHRHRGAVHDPRRRAAGRPLALLRAVPAAHARHARRCGSCRPSGSGSRSRRSTKILFPFVDDEIFNPEGLVSSPADPNFLKVFGT